MGPLQWFYFAILPFLIAVLGVIIGETFRARHLYTEPRTETAQHRTTSFRTEIEQRVISARVAPNLRRVITAAALGSVIEWYDFYIFGTLVAVLSVKFFEKSHPVAALLSTIGLFTAGFLIRPLGALTFGWIGDRIGRKYTSLMTIMVMGLSTGAIGLIPTFDQIGVAAVVA